MCLVKIYKLRYAIKKKIAGGIRKLTIDMKYFNVYYFCHLANESMGKFEYATNYGIFVEQEFAVDPEEFPKVSVLRQFCYWLVERIIWEQVSLISNEVKNYDFDPVSWVCQAIKKYRDIDVDGLFEQICAEDKEEADFEELFNVFVEKLDDLYCNVIWDIATEIEYILFQNREFLVRFNETMASAFEDNNRKRIYVPEWVKRAVLFRDRGCCVFCKKDLTGIYTLLDDREKQFDHIVPLEEGGLNDVCNIQLTCQECNQKKHTQSGTSTLYQTAY